MAVEKLSISFDPDLARVVRDEAESEGESVSAWLAEAARARARHLALGRLIDDYVEETGITRAELRHIAADLRAQAEWPNGRLDSTEPKT